MDESNHVSFSFHHYLYTPYFIDTKEKHQAYLISNNYHDSLSIETGITIREKRVGAGIDYLGSTLANKSSHVINNWNNTVHNAIGIIQNNYDTTIWNFTLLNYGNPLFMYNFVGKMFNGKDSIQTSIVDRYVGEKQQSSNLFINHDYIKGILFYKNGHQIGAIKIMGRKSVWISKTLDKNTFDAIASLMILLSNTIKE